MNDQQERVIEKVNEAMQELEKAGLALAGIDDSLFVFPLEEYERYGKPSAYEIPIYIDYQILTVPYVDSGAT